MEWDGCFGPWWREPQSCLLFILFKRGPYLTTGCECDITQVCAPGHTVRWVGWSVWASHPPQRPGGILPLVMSLVGSHIADHARHTRWSNWGAFFFHSLSSCCKGFSHALSSCMVKINVIIICTCIIWLLNIALKCLFCILGGKGLHKCVSIFHVNNDAISRGLAPPLTTQQRDLPVESPLSCRLNIVVMCPCTVMFIAWASSTA